MTPAGPIEVGTVGPDMPGIIYPISEKFFAYESLNIRECESKVCDIIGSLPAYSTRDVFGKVVNEAGERWVCLVVDHVGPADLCSKAVLYVDNQQKEYGLLYTP